MINIVYLAIFFIWFIIGAHMQSHHVHFLLRGGNQNEKKNTVHIIELHESAGRWWISVHCVWIWIIRLVCLPVILVFFALSFSSSKPFSSVDISHMNNIRSSIWNILWICVWVFFSLFSTKWFTKHTSLFWLMCFQPHINNLVLLLCNRTGSSSIVQVH